MLAERPKQTERARIGQRTGIDLRVDVFQRQGWIDGDTAGGTEVTESQKIHPQWRRRVGAWFKLLGMRITCRTRNEQYGGPSLRNPENPQKAAGNRDDWE